MTGFLRVMVMVTITLAAIYLAIMLVGFAVWCYYAIRIKAEDRAIKKLEALIRKNQP